MIKTFTPVLLYFLLLTNLLSAQKEANTWYFSTSRGIDFNSGSPVLLTTSGMSEYEGCSSISDPVTGSILMYTDGMSVWGKNHLVMPNGSGLQSTYAAGQQGLIVPDPGNLNQYYIFTSGEYYNGGTDGYRYNIVDITLNGGIGDVTATKNVLMYAPASEKLCAIRKPNGNYWIATHQYSGNKFRIYELSESGISAPVESSVGTPFTGVNPDGCLKFSSDGTRLILSLGGSNAAEVFDFDVNTGIVSNPITLGPVSAVFPYTYGVCFSPNGKLAYVSEENTNYIYQYNLDLPTPTEINASKTQLGPGGAYAMQTMQLAPDGKMYVCDNGGAYLCVVNEPDVIGTGCNFVANGFYLNGGYSSYGLPNFPENVFSTSSPLPVSNFTADQFICQKFCVDYIDQSQNAPTSWEWIFEGGSPSNSTQQNPVQVCYNTAGTYDVTLITGNAFGNDTLVMSDYITVYATPALPTITQTGYTLTSSPAASYQWQQNSVDISGATNQTYEVLQTGFYSVIITDSNGCISSNTTYVLITGIENENSVSDFLVYPNPSNGTFEIELLNGIITGNASIIISNALGQIVFSSNEVITSKFRKDIHVKNASSGIYVLQIINSQNSFQQKIIISK